MCGLPVVGSRAGGIPDVISDGRDGFLFPVGDSVGAADTLSRALLLSGAVRRRVGEAARRTITTGFTGVHEADILEPALLHLMEG